MDEKNSHPLNVNSTDLYNIVDGQVAPTHVNGQDALHIGSQREKFIALLPGAFHSNIEKKLNNMQNMKKVVIVNGMAIFDIETRFARPYSQPATTRDPSPSPNYALRQHIRGIHQSTLVTSAVSVGMSIKVGLLHNVCPMHR